jgi:ankyrin repeat protein
MKPSPILALLLLALILIGCTEPARPTISLYRAIQVGDLDQIKRHIRWGTDLNQPDPNGDLPLHVAARAGQVSIARELAGNGADLEARNKAGETPMDLALAHGKTKVAELLLGFRVGLDPQAALVTLVGKGISDRDAFDFLIRRGADTNRPDPQGQAPLHLAIRLGHLETTRRLLQRGADVNRPDGAGRTPLALAQGLDPGASHARDIIATLRQYGARLPAETPTGPSADSTAVQTGEPQ